MRIFFFFLSLSFLFSGYASASNKFHVIVDPGHGGSDSGATKGKIREAEIALSVGKELHSLLEKSRNYRVTLTRTKDETVPLAHRTKMARDLKADLFLSIHCNSNLDQRAYGPEFYFPNQLPPEEETLFLANKENESEAEAVVELEEKKQISSLNTIIDDLKKTYHLILSRDLASHYKRTWTNDFNTRRSHIRQGPFQVLHNVNMPSLLVELGFLTNSREAHWLNNPETHKELALTLYKGIQNIKEKIDKHKESGDSTAHAN